MVSAGWGSYWVASSNIPALDFLLCCVVLSEAKKVTLNIEEPKSGVTKAEIDAAMQVVVDNNVFNTSGGDITEAVEGCLRTVTRDVVAE